MGLSCTILGLEDQPGLRKKSLIWRHLCFFFFPPKDQMRQRNQRHTCQTIFKFLLRSSLVSIDISTKTHPSKYRLIRLKIPPFKFHQIPPSPKTIINSFTNENVAVMKTTINQSSSSSSSRKPLPLKSFILSLFLSLAFLFFLFSLPPLPHSNFIKSSQNAPPRTGLQIRPGFTSYDFYIQRQLNKTLNPKLRRIWLTRDWDRKINVFSKFFSKLKSQGLLYNDSKALCIGARVGQEVTALKLVGVDDSIGIDLVPYPPLVLKGDFHDQPFDSETFDFEFSNVFDHALYPEKFVGEIERTLRPGGVCVLHVAVSRRNDKYSANDLFSVQPLIGLFKMCDLVYVRKVDGFGLDTEVVLKKKMKIRRRFLF